MTTITSAGTHGADTAAILPHRDLPRRLLAAVEMRVKTNEQTALLVTRSVARGKRNSWNSAQREL